MSLFFSFRSLFVSSGGGGGGGVPSFFFYPFPLPPQKLGNNDLLAAFER